jgi:glycosyltransferase involved in cell wall biosynthesis
MEIERGEGPEHNRPAEDGEPDMVTMEELYASMATGGPGMMPMGAGMPYPMGEPQEYKPYVSVIVPCRNEEGFIARCLQALESQDYPRERFEVIVVDGNSTDGTAREVREMVLAYGLPDVFKSNPGQTTAKGLNLGLQNAGGEIVIRVDGHVRVDPDFISQSVKALMDTGADAVGGPIRTRGHGPIGRAIALAMASPFGVGDASFRLTSSSEEGAKKLWTDSVPFAAYHRNAFRKAGLFAEDLNFGEDDEFNYRLRESGGRILLSPKIGSIYFSRSDLKGLLRQYWNYGLAKAEVLRRHPRRAKPRHLVPSALVVVVAAGPTLGLFSKRIRLLSLLAAVSYAAANGITSWRIGRDGNRQEMPYLPVAFAAMHFGAGAGFLVGLARSVQKRLQGDEQ